MGKNVICKVAACQLGDKTVGRIVGLKTLGDAEIVDEALRKAYVSGQANIILGNFCGVMKCMTDSVRRDGNGRKIDSVCSIQPWMKGRLDDPSDPLDTSKVKVVLRARALKEMGIDVSNWTFVIEGTTGTVVINAVSTGEKVGEIVLGEAVHVTGKELAMGDGDTVGWEIPEEGHHGTVSPTKVTSDATRITLAADAFSGLVPGPDLDGKTIVLTFMIGNRKAVKSAVLRYVG